MNNYLEPPEGYTPPELALQMLEEIEEAIDTVQNEQERTGAYKEVLSLLYAERAAILEIINELP